ncbi:hypothetical protein [Limnofasciculus baicalensis]|uniref:Uncharacterized protein n=1 Tax=Limnofasciculus baicalensis BBK-W-15 TaxID=2699891 RepID=A0AAE3KM17_9CYAN|nr:hypothetical protein [Limnofasciculus baicalensis]MCP2728296.1 hypothetical protein [Limnofasciculus baicalensis BBK-W-15]
MISGWINHGVMPQVNQQISPNLRDFYLKMKRINIITADSKFGLRRNVKILDSLLKEAGFSVMVYILGEKTVCHKIQHLLALPALTVSTKNTPKITMLSFIWQVAGRKVRKQFLKYGNVTRNGHD